MTANIFGDQFKNPFPHKADGASAISFLLDTVALGIELLAQIAGALCVLMLIYAAVRMIAALGNDDAIAAAWSIAKHALIGLFVSVSAYLLVQLTLMLSALILS